VKAQGDAHELASTDEQQQRLVVRRRFSDDDDAGALRGGENFRGLGVAVDVDVGVDVVHALQRA
jgi:hypothetical protein